MCVCVCSFVCLNSVSVCVASSRLGIAKADAFVTAGAVRETEDRQTTTRAFGLVHLIVFDDERKDEAEIICLLLSLFYTVTPRGRLLVDTIQSGNRNLLAGWRLGGGCAVHYISLI